MAPHLLSAADRPSGPGLIALPHAR